MKINHIGYACKNIQEGTDYFCSLMDIKAIGPIIYDPLQDIHVRIIEPEVGCHFELVCGPNVESYVSLGTVPYHICLECEDIWLSIRQMQQKGAYLIKEPIPAALFSKRRVAFLNTDIGMVELLELAEDKPAGKLELCIASNFTVDPVKVYFEYCNKMLSYEFVFEYAPYNQIMQSLLDPAGVYNRQDDDGYNIMLISLEQWLYDRPVSKEEIGFSAFFERNCTDLIQAIISLQSLRPFILILCPSGAHIDSFLKETVLCYENMIYDAFETNDTVSCIRSKQMIQAFGDGEYTSGYTNSISHIPYIEEFYATMATCVIREVKRRQGYRYKVIVLDCDNTLWNGISGDVDPERLILSADKRFLQTFMLEQMQHGMLLCLCTKNNEETIDNIFARRNDMPLKKEHFSAIKANWKSKSENISELAYELGLSLDSFIFIDDSQYECDQMHAMLPEVTVLLLPSSDSELIGWVQRQWIFDRGSASEEGRQRTQLIKTEKKRRDYRERSNSLRQFIDGLELTLQIEPMADNDINRVSELSIRTNQFATSSRKQTPQEIRMLKESGYGIYTVRVKDRFGDYGLVGAVIFDPVEVCIDSFILSCRVLGRGVEHKVLSQIGKILNRQNIAYVTIHLTQTNRNMLAVEFFTNVLGQACLNKAVKITTEELIKLRYKPQEHMQNRRAVSILDMQNSNHYNKICSLFSPHNVFKSSNNVFSAHNATQSIQLDTLESIYAELLGHKVSKDDDFFNNGGNSLLAVQLLNRLYKMTGVEIPLGIFYLDSSIRSVSRHIGDSFSGKGQKQENSQEDESGWEGYFGRYPLSRAQTALWQYEQETGGFHNCMPLTLDIQGNFNTTAYQYALDKIVQKHESLRAVFRTDDHGVFQTYSSSNHIPIVIDDFSMKVEEVDAAVREEERYCFDIENGPLIRTRILLLGKERFVLSLSIHHLIFDGWSYKLFFKDLSAFYSEFKNGKKRIKNENHTQRHYLNYVLWEKEYEISKKKLKDMAFWRSQLAGIVYTPIPAETSVEKEETSYAFALAKSDVIQLVEICRRKHISNFTAFLSVYSIVLSFLTQTTEVAVGTVVSLRDTLEFNQIVGLFINTIVMRCQIDMESSFEDILNENWTMVLQSLEHKEAYFGDVIEQSGLEITTHADNPFYQTMFVYQNELHDVPILQGAQVRKYKKGYDTARADLVMELHESDQSVSGVVYYRNSCFSAPFIHKVTELLKQALYLGVWNPDICIKDLHQMLGESWTKLQSSSSSNSNGGV
jgi:FkbH-like protein